MQALKLSDVFTGAPSEPYQTVALACHTAGKDGHYLAFVRIDEQTWAAVNDNAVEVIGHHQQLEDRCAKIGLYPLAAFLAAA